MRLFQVCSPDVEENSNNNEGASLSQMTVDLQLLIAERDRAVAERDFAHAERNAARRKSCCMCG